MKLKNMQRKYINRFIMSLIIVTVTVLGYTYHEVEEENEAIVAKELTAKAESIKRFIEIWIKTKRNIIIETSHNVARMSMAKDENIKGLLISASNTIDAVDTYVIMNNGMSYSSVGTSVRGRYMKAAEKDKYLHKSEDVVGAHIDKDTGVHVITITEDITYGKRTIGIILSDIKIDELAELMHELSVVDEYPTLIDSENRIITHPIKEMIGMNINTFVDDLGTGIADDNGIYEYRFNGQEKIMSYVYIKEIKIKVLTTKVISGTGMLVAKKMVLILGFMLIILAAVIAITSVGLGVAQEHACDISKNCKCEKE